MHIATLVPGTDNYMGGYGGGGIDPEMHLMLIA